MINSAEIDTNGDGQISAVESETARNFIRTKISEKRAEKFAEIAGDDGALSPEELAAIPALSNASEERIFSIFARLDSDESGDITLDEFTARLRKYGRPEETGKPEDTGNGNGRGKGKGKDKDKDRDDDDEDPVDEDPVDETPVDEDPVDEGGGCKASPFDNISNQPV